MTDKDEMAMRAEMMTEFKTLEGKLATHQEAVFKRGKEMARLGEALQRSNFLWTTIDQDSVWIPATSNVSQDGTRVSRMSFDVEALEALLDEIRQMTNRQSELRPRLESIGFIDKLPPPRR